jgi:hypothetical protein
LAFAAAVAHAVRHAREFVEIVDLAKSLAKPFVSPVDAAAAGVARAVRHSPPVAEIVDPTTPVVAPERAVAVYGRYYS